MDQVQPKISVEYIENATIATLTDEQILDEADVQGLEKSIMPLVEEAEVINLVIDFSNIKFLTSAVLGILIRVSKKIYESDGQLKLCSINSKILEIFKVTRLDRIFDICEDRSAAIQDFD
ncbi:MAG: STAS domain-containing protein [Planctomycetota bacterium]|jgi:anti-sigma B factor antagonist